MQSATARAGRLLLALAWLIAGALPGGALAQSCPLAAVDENTAPPLLKGRGLLVRANDPAAIAFRSAVERDDDGAPDAYHRGLPDGGPDPGLDHICAGGSVMEYSAGRLVQKYAAGGSVGTLAGPASKSCKKDYIAMRDAGFPECGPGKLCMLWYGIQAEPRRCGYPSAFGGADITSCGTPILQEGREFYLTTTALMRPDAPSGSRKQSDYVDAATVPYLVLPSGLKLPDGLQWRTGDLGAMLWKGKVVYVLVGDLGPSAKIGEASRAALAALTGNPMQTIGSANPATTLFFPGTRDLVLDKWPIDPQRLQIEGEKLVARLGGAAALAKCPGFSGFN